jgi:hypothetical protein
MALLWRLAIIAVLGFARPALAGPPYVSDDPEPTDYKHFEIYAFSNATATRDGRSGEMGIDLNYGAAPNLQLTATLPAGFQTSAADGTRVGASNVELAAKYRFLHQDTFGWDVAIFPRLFLPSPSAGIGDANPSLLLPIWVQKDWGQWSMFGGGGCTFNIDTSKNSCVAGWVMTRKVLPSSPARIGILSPDSGRERHSCVLQSRGWRDL